MKKTSNNLKSKTLLHMNSQIIAENHKIMTEKTLSWSWTKKMMTRKNLKKKLNRMKKERYK